MRYLVIDRSTARPGVAVFDGASLVCSAVWDSEPARAQNWLAETSFLLKRHGVGWDSIEGFVCGLGPGSFSGIRASLSAVQGLALPKRQPVLGVASAAAVAFGEAASGRSITVVGDARRDRLWCVSYRVDPVSGRLRLDDGAAPTHTAADFQLVPAGELAARIPSGTRIVTSDWSRVSGMLSAMFEPERLVASAVFPDVTVLGRLALSSLDGCRVEPLPIYLHPAVAARPA